MRLRTALPTVAAVVLLGAGAAAVPAQATPTGTAPTMAGDLLEVTSLQRALPLTRPAGSMLARAGQARLTSTSPHDLRVRGVDGDSGAVASLAFTAPTATAFRVGPRPGAGRTYSLGPNRGAGVAGLQAVVAGQSCAVQSGELTVDRVVAGPAGVTGLSGRYLVTCQAGWELHGVIDLGLDGSPRYGEALATPLGRHDLGALPVGSATRVDLQFTYRGTGPSSRYPAGSLTLVPTPEPGASGFTFVAAADAPVTAQTCDRGGLVDGDTCTVTLTVSPSKRGAGNVVVRLGTTIGGYTAYTYRGVAAGLTGPHRPGPERGRMDR